MYIRCTGAILKAEGVVHMTLAEKIYDLSMLWRQAAFVFPHFHRCGVDWDEIYREYLNRVLETKTDREHALLMAEFLNCLGDGHTDVSFSKRILDETGYLPFGLEFVEGGYCVDGERVLGFDGRPMEDILQEAFRYVYHVGGFVPRLRYILPFVLGPGAHTLETASGSRPFAMMAQRPDVPRRQETLLGMCSALPLTICSGTEPLRSGKSCWKQSPGR